ncbi:hypothetical protein GCM10027435_09800 [Haloparvum alkalitolerans]|uniref:conditioned medium-induced protein 4 n=1 Tax=Haloparvum alkalitolerans TaxID=1042953 RepID=UPI003CF6C9C6
MDEKTEELRDIFVDATGSETVTERQEESPGSLADRDEASVEERLAEVVAAMRDRDAFATDLDDAALRRVARGHFAGESDAEIAAAVDATADDVFEARMDLHLVSEADRDAPLDLDALRRLDAEGVPVEERADRLDADRETVRRYSAVVAADRAATRANERFRDAFRELLTDDDLSEAHARDAREDGLREATEDIETDVSL